MIHNMEENAFAKQQAEAMRQAKYAASINRGIPNFNIAPDQCAGAMTNERAARIPLREQLERGNYEANALIDKRSRALGILQAHPEFELFLELQEIINSGLWR